MTTRMPTRSDSSRTALMPSIRFSFTREAILAIMEALFTWNGISLTMMA